MPNTAWVDSVMTLPKTGSLPACEEHGISEGSKMRQSGVLSHSRSMWNYVEPLDISCCSNK